MFLLELGNSGNEISGEDGLFRGFLVDLIDEVNSQEVEVDDDFLEETYSNQPSDPNLKLSLVAMLILVFL